MIFLTVAELTDNPLSHCRLFDATGCPSRICISTSVFKSDEAREERASKAGLFQGMTAVL
jgi:hypothetical protein